MVTPGSDLGGSGRHPVGRGRGKKSLGGGKQEKEINILGDLKCKSWEAL